MLVADFCGSVYESLMNEYLVDFERFNDNLALTNVLHKVQVNSEEATNNDDWVAAMSDVLNNNDNIVR
jgi:hypothetical protein